MSGYEDVLRSKVDVAVAEWRNWLEREGDADEFHALFAQAPTLEMIPHEGSSVWIIHLAEEGEKSLAFCLHREKSDRRREEREDMEAEAEAEVVTGPEEDEEP